MNVAATPSANDPQVTHLHGHLAEVGDFISAEEAAKGFNPVALVLRIMRGRWLAAILTAALLGALFGTAGYLATSPGYESRAIIRISAREPSILFSSGDDSRLKLFNAFVKGEATFVASRPVMERAAGMIGTLPGRDEPLTALGLSHASSIQRKDSLLVITAEGDTAVGAAAKVNAIVAAYQALHRENDARRAGYRENELAARERQLLDKLHAIKARMLEVGGEFGANSLAKAHISKIGQIDALEARVAEVRGTLAALEARGPAADVDTGDDLTKRAILLDRGLADLSYEKAKREAELAAMLVRMEDKHMPVVAKRAELKVIDEAIAARRQQIATLARTGALTDAEASEEQTVAEVAALLAKVEEDLATARAEARALNAKRIELTFLEEERGEVRRMLDETRRALDVVRVESRNALPGIVEVISDGAVPEAPADDMRLVLGAGGFMAGAGFGGVLFLGLGLLSTRLRYSDDLGAATDRTRLLAVIRAGRRRRRREEEGPIVEGPLLAAAHEVRNAIQLWPLRRRVASGRGRIVMLAGEGEVPAAEAIALATSFERAGLAPLLVDADLADGTLTRRLGCESVAGWRELLATGGRTGGEVTAVGGVSAVLPAGADAGVDGSSVSLPAVRAALGALAEEAPVVVVHAGASANALCRELIAAEADVAILVCRRGESRSRVTRLARRLDDLALNGAGLVFAGARRGDPGLAA